jgi:hypothetical protein
MNLFFKAMLWFSIDKEDYIYQQWIRLRGKNHGFLKYVVGVWFVAYAYGENLVGRELTSYKFFDRD